MRQLFCVTLLCSSFYAVTKFASVYFYVSAFQDFVKNEVEFAPFRERADEKHLLVNILDAARYYNLEVDPNEIKIHKTVTIPGMTWSTTGVDFSYTHLGYLSFFTKHLTF